MITLKYNRGKTANRPLPKLHETLRTIRRNSDIGKIRRNAKAYFSSSWQGFPVRPRSSLLDADFPAKNALYRRFFAPLRENCEKLTRNKWDFLYQNANVFPFTIGKK